MRQVFKTAAGFTVEDAPAPGPPEDGVLVRVERSLISPGTETMGLGAAAPAAAAGASADPGPGLLESLRRKTGLARKGLASLATRGLGETWAATRAYFQATGVTIPVIAPDTARTPTGYSCAGTVIARADREGLPPVGVRVACAGAGIANHAELVAVPRHLCAIVPEALSWDEATYGTLGAIALHGVRRAEAEPGDVVVVSGLGLVGLLALQIARASGCRVVGIDLDPDRLARARALGAELAFSPGERDPVAAVRDATHGAGADRVLLCLATGSSEPTNQALRMSRRRGRVVVVGMTGLSIDREPFFKGEVDLVISTSYGPGRYDPTYELLGHDYPPGHVRWTEHRNLEEFLRLVAVRSVDVRALTDHTWPLEEASEAYRSFATARPRPIGVLLGYGRGPVPLSTTPVARRDGPRARTVAVIGGGAFVRSVHLPILRRRGFAVSSVTNRTAASSVAVARECGVDTRALVNWREALQDDSVDLVVIGTRHGTHAEIAAAALDAGKHVLLEKPAATTREGLALVRAARARHPELVLAVGHNRRFSRYAIELRERLARRGGADLLAYRVNAPFIPRDSWIQDLREGGGRIIGEGTHFLDLVAFLAADPAPELVGAVAAPPDGGAVVARDSYQALLRAKSGAPIHIVYTAQGDRALPKERVVAFAGGARFELDDYHALRGPDAPLEGDADKGFERLWDELEKAIRGEPSLLPPPEDAFHATALAFGIEDRIRGLSELARPGA